MSPKNCVAIFFDGKLRLKLLDGKFYTWTLHATRFSLENHLMYEYNMILHVFGVSRIREDLVANGILHILEFNYVAPSRLNLGTYYIYSNVAQEQMTLDPPPYSPK